MADEVFCTKCGKKLEPDMQFCPACGQMIAGTKAEEEFKREQAEFVAMVKEGNMIWLTFFLAIYAIPAIILGIFAIVDSSMTANAIMNDPAIVNWFKDHGIILTFEMVQSYIYSIGVVELASGLCVLGSLICVYRRKVWGAAVALCFIGAILCVWSIFGMFIGVLVTLMIYNSRDSFPGSCKAVEA